MYTLEKINSGYSLFSGNELSDGYKVYRYGHLVFLLLKDKRGGYTEYYQHDGQWKTGQYFAYRPTLKAWKKYYGIAD